MKTLWQTKRGRAEQGIRRLKPVSIWLALLFEPRDAWIGVYWNRPEVAWAHALDVYVCIVPFLPFKMMFRVGTFRQWRTSLTIHIAERVDA